MRTWGPVAWGEEPYRFPSEKDFAKGSTGSLLSKLVYVPSSFPCFSLRYWKHSNSVEGNQRCRHQKGMGRQRASQNRAHTLTAFPTEVPESEAQKGVNGIIGSSTRLTSAPMT